MTDFALISKKDAAARLAVSERTIDRLRADGDLDTVPVRGLIRIPVDSIDAVMRRALERDEQERRSIDASRARPRQTGRTVESLDDAFPIRILDERRRSAA